MPQSKVYQCSDEEFSAIVKNAKSFSDCCRAVGLSTKGRHGPMMIKERCNQLGLTTDHFERNSSPSARYTLDEILVENSTYLNIARLKKRLLDEDKLPYVCAFCGNKGEWQGKPLTLQLDHINGNHTDHRIENLRFLCPNCHSQTETYAGRGQRRAN